MNYKEKYYKYKTKYLELKKHNNPDDIKQIGGKIFKKVQILYIVATISQAKLKRITKEITDTILGKNIKPYRDPHITLFNLIINAENSDNIIFQNEDFYNQIKKIYSETIADKNNPLILKAVPFPRDFSFSGFRPRYFIKNYKQSNPEKILDFRKRIFNLIETILGKPEIKKYIDKNGSKYSVYSFGGKELFAESTYYNFWKPHINFLNEFDIQKNNPDLYQELNKYRSGIEKVDVLANKIKYVPLGIYDEINMFIQMINITYAIDRILQIKLKI